MLAPANIEVEYSIILVLVSLESLLNPAFFFWNSSSTEKSEAEWDTVDIHPVNCAVFEFGVFFWSDMWASNHNSFKVEL